MQSLFVAAAQSKQPAIEKQGDAFDRYSSLTRRFREELRRVEELLEESPLAESTEDDTGNPSPDGRTTGATQGGDDEPQR